MSLTSSEEKRMKTETMIKLPVIDFSQLTDDGSPEWESVRQQVHHALQEYGCFEAFYPGLFPQNLRKSLFDGLKQLFQLPLPIKLKNLSDDDVNSNGYIGQAPTVPLYESLAIVHADSHENIEKFTDLLWSNGNPELRKSIECFSKEVAKLDKIVRRMVLESFGLEKYMKEHLESTNDLVRFNKYDAPNSKDTTLGLAPHIDNNVLTTLCQNEVNGLNILTKDNQWINTNPSPDSVIVMAGMAFHAWTNGRVHPPEHKVMVEGEVDRYSIGLFAIPNPGYIIKAPEEMVDEEHPLLFKPFDNAEYLKHFFANVKDGVMTDLKAYCGTGA